MGSPRLPSTRPSAPTQPKISVALLDSTGTQRFARASTEPYYAASTIKLAVLLAAAIQVDDGQLSLSAQLPATRTFAGINGTEFALADDHLDEQFPADGTPVAVSELLRVMITRSSNEATNMIIGLVGLSAVAGVCSAPEMPHTRVERLIGDPASVDAGLTNETSAADLVTLMRAMVTGENLTDSPPLSAAMTNFICDCLMQQTIAPIGGALPNEVSWGSKSGSVDGIRHDVAFVETPTGRHYLSVCTQGYEVEAADEAIGAIAEALVEPLLDTI